MKWTNRITNIHRKLVFFLRSLLVVYYHHHSTIKSDGGPKNAHCCRDLRPQSETQLLYVEREEHERRAIISSR